MKSSSDKTKTNYNNAGTDNSPGGGRKTVRLIIEGIVQGVGFRPFLHRLADRHSVSGWVRNTSSGLEGVLKGTPTSLEDFLSELKTSPPPMASVEAVRTEAIPEDPGSADFSGFKIL